LWGFFFKLIDSYSLDVNVDTKIKGDIAEQAAILHALKRGWGVLKPVGDRLPYDLVFDVDGTLIKIQVKYAWFEQPSSNYVVDNRRTKTNRRLMVRDAYKQSDFDFVLVYVVDVFIGYGSEIHLVEAAKQQRKPRSAQYRDAWELILQEAVESPFKRREAVSRMIPHQPIAVEKLVEPQYE
jgi:hypothetical protein